MRIKLISNSVDVISTTFIINRCGFRRIYKATKNSSPSLTLTDGTAKLIPFSCFPNLLFLSSPWPKLVFHHAPPIISSRATFSVHPLFWKLVYVHLFIDQLPSTEYHMLTFPIAAFITCLKPWLPFNYSFCAAYLFQHWYLHFGFFTFSYWLFVVYPNYHAILSWEILFLANRSGYCTLLTSRSRGAKPNYHLCSTMYLNIWSYNSTNWNDFRDFLTSYLWNDRCFTAGVSSPVSN